MSDIESVHGRSILVTGASGSFGRSFVKQILTHHAPARLVVFSRDELKQSDMQQELGTADHPCLRYFIGDVRDQDRLEMAMRGIEIVVHAAALKQVPVAEYNPFECIRTNVIGAQNVVQASIRAGVSKVIALSTDKAASPINLYGASKLAADKIFVAANNLTGASGTKFSVVRYGNVLGSRGSVIPLFRRLLAQGATSLPITDTRMTRFLITLQQGVNFVIDSLASMRGGELFVPKIPSARMVDVARAVAPDAGHEVVGIRPGEKLHESLITRDDARFTLDLGDRYVILPSAPIADLPGREDFDGSPVPEGFVYESDLNSDMLDVDGVRRLIQEAGV